MTKEKVECLVETTSERRIKTTSRTGMYFLVLSLSIDSVSAYLIHKDTQCIRGTFTTFVKELLELTSLNQDLDLVYAIRSCIHEVLSRNGLDSTDIKGISLVSKYPSFLIWESDTGKPIFGPIDLQTEIPYEEFTWKTKSSIVKDIEAQSGTFYSPQFCLYHLRELKKTDPSFTKILEEKNCKFGSLDVWVLYQLTGLTSFKMDVSIASKTQLLTEETKQWDSLLLSEAGLTEAHVPEIVCEEDSLGLTKSFVPFDDGIPIVSMTSHEVAVHSAICKESFNSVYLDTTKDLRLSLFSSLAPQEQLPYFNKTYFAKAESIHYLMDTYLFSIHDFESVLKQLGVSLASLQRLTDPILPKPGFYVVPNNPHPPFPGLRISKKWSMIGIDETVDERAILWALIQSIVYTLKQQLLKTEIVMNRRVSQLFVVGEWSTSEVVLQYLADQLQMTITTIETEHPHVLGSLSYRGNQAESEIKKTYLPLLDPLTSYSTFQEWEKVMANLDALFGDL